MIELSRSTKVTRRLVMPACAAAFALACVGRKNGEGVRMGAEAPAKLRSARLTARPGRPSDILQPGLHSLGIVATRDALLYIPPQIDAGELAHLAVSLHGAGGTAERGIALLRGEADRAGFLVLAPASRRATWDLLTGGFGPDVRMMDQALSAVFERCSVHEDIAISGFSDGASYALSLGLANGDLFQDIIAFSPGVMAPPFMTGQPRIYISHGKRDQILPVSACSRRIVPQLRKAGYAVEYNEFDGRHEIPQQIRREAVDWWLRRGEAR